MSYAYMHIFSKSFHTLNRMYIPFLTFNHIPLALFFIRLPSVHNFNDCLVFYPVRELHFIYLLMTIEIDFCFAVRYIVVINILAYNIRWLTISLVEILGSRNYGVKFMNNFKVSWYIVTNCFPNTLSQLIFPLV